MTDSLELACRAARAAVSKQAEAVVVLDMRELITITDYFVIGSANSERQVKTITDEVMRALKAEGIRPVRKEGEPGARWVLLDFVDFVVHVFEQEERDFYRLEHLWVDAPRVPWEDSAKSAAGETNGSA